MISLQAQDVNENRWANNTVCCFV